MIPTTGMRPHEPDARIVRADARQGVPLARRYDPGQRTGTRHRTPGTQSRRPQRQDTRPVRARRAHDPIPRMMETGHGVRARRGRQVRGRPRMMLHIHVARRTHLANAVRLQHQPVQAQLVRMLAHALGSARLRTALVDGNPGQQSQRAWLNIPDSKALEYALVDGLQSALVRPRDTGGMFALLAGPADPHSRDMARDYLESIIGLRAMCDMVVVDADRVDGRLWDDPASFAGGVMRPMVEAGGARILFRIGQSGSQTDDGLAALDAIRRPDRIRAVAVAPPGVKPWPARRWHALLDGLAEYGGVDVWDEASRRLVDSHACGWARIRTRGGPRREGGDHGCHGPGRDERRQGGT